MSVRNSRQSSALSISERSAATRRTQGSRLVCTARGILASRSSGEVLQNAVPVADEPRAFASVMSSPARLGSSPIVPSDVVDGSRFEIPLSSAVSHDANEAWQAVDSSHCPQSRTSRSSTPASLRLSSGSYSRASPSLVQQTSESSSLTPNDLVRLLEDPVSLLDVDGADGSEIVADALDAFVAEGVSLCNDLFAGEKTPKMRYAADDDSDLEDCPICLAPIAGCFARTRCNHCFHVECLEQHLAVGAGHRPTCPLCRTKMDLKLPVSANSTSGREIEVLHRVPLVGSECHFDRPYTFLSLGDFAEKTGMLYVQTSNDDRKTPSWLVMWTLTSTVPSTVYLNFRTVRHVTDTGVVRWLEKDGWEMTSMSGTATTGFPNGIYFGGPVFSKDFEAGDIPLKGSACWEGTYFVFVELREEDTKNRMPWDVEEITDSEAATRN